MNSIEEGHICKPPRRADFYATHLARWSSFRRPLVTSSLAAEESDSGFDSQWKLDTWRNIQQKNLKTVIGER